MNELFVTEEIINAICSKPFKKPFKKKLRPSGYWFEDIAVIRNPGTKKSPSIFLFVSTFFHVNCYYFIAFVI